MRKLTLFLVAMAIFLQVFGWLDRFETPATAQAHSVNYLNTLNKISSDETSSADIEDSDVFFQKTISKVGRGRDTTREVEALLKRMTLEEKVGQMTQLQIGMVTTGKDQD
ncbi:MAG: hypothetical protein ACREA9_28665, partial [Pyrinomonadaceae bacterium]